MPPHRLELEITETGCMKVARDLSDDAIEQIGPAVDIAYRIETVRFQ
jgi:hypothetical protein